MASCHRILSTAYAIGFKEDLLASPFADVCQWHGSSLGNRQMTHMRHPELVSGSINTEARLHCRGYGC